ncbi:unnamed protein product [Linum tenue]|uniref:C3H1-type domain-containing protein n=1 Tax=Linum tenue TaxID=586396 RepID=A0AAV0S7G4_9ROSI|nr:unnamed protein product [Linum tenue]
MEESPPPTAADFLPLLLSPLKPNIKVADWEHRRRSSEIPDLNLDYVLRREPTSDSNRPVTSLEKESSAGNQAPKSEQISLLDRLALTAPVPCYFFRYGLCTKGDECSFSHGAAPTTTDHVRPPPPPPQPRQLSNNSSLPNDNRKSTTLEVSANAYSSADHQQQPTGRGKDETTVEENVVEERSSLRMFKERLLARPLSSGGKGFFDLREQLRKRKAGDFKGPKSLAQIREEKRRRAEEQNGQGQNEDEVSCVDCGVA